MKDISQGKGGRLLCTISFLLTYSIFAQSPDVAPKKEAATFAAGCFWGLEDTLSRVRGVIDTEVGFMGGAKAFPSYREVISGHSGHIEVVRVYFDPEKVSYKELLSVFFAYHKPSDFAISKTGPGSQYQSIIYFHQANQEKEARAFMKTQAAKGYIPLNSTSLRRVSRFYPAGIYHQDYYRKRACAPPKKHP